MLVFAQFNRVVKNSTRHILLHMVSKRKLIRCKSLVFLVVIVSLNGRRKNVKIYFSAEFSAFASSKSKTVHEEVAEAVCDDGKDRDKEFETWKNNFLVHGSCKAQLLLQLQLSL